MKLEIAYLRPDIFHSSCNQDNKHYFFVTYLTQPKATNKGHYRDGTQNIVLVRYYVLTGFKNDE